MKSEGKEYARRFLILLLAVDVAFIVLHIIHIGMNLLPSIAFSVKTGFGYGEMYQYAKELWVAMLLVMVAMKRRHILYITRAFLFLSVLADDCFLIHEELTCCPML